MKEQIIVGAVAVNESFEHYFTQDRGRANFVFSPAEAREFAKRLMESADEVERKLADL